MRQFFAELFAAIPDMRFEVLDVVAARNQAAVRWHSTGTFCGGPFQGIEPTGARVELSEMVIHRFEDGRIAESWRMTFPDSVYDAISAG